MTPQKKILLFDDIQSQAKSWRDELQSLVDREVQGMAVEEFLECIRVLEKRRKQARASDEPFENFDSSNSACALDETGIFLVDYDLLEVDQKIAGGSAAYMTGESIAYLARCYSSCDVIVALNQFGSRTFDLRLRGHPESFADLNVGSDHFANHGLWKEDDWSPDRFRPWSWPILPQLEKDFASRLEDLRENMEVPILEFLGLAEEDVGILPRDVSEFLETQDRKHTEVTFQDFVKSSRQGLRPKDETSLECMRRIAAARVHKWLECFVLAGQDVLVDAPHLVSRFPSLLAGSPDRLESWNATASLHQPKGLDHEKIRAHRFEKQHWLSRPAWFWNKVRENGAIKEVEDPWSGPEGLDCAFCEDTSTFVPTGDTEEFVCDVPSAFVRRYVARLHDVDYQPTIRFAF